VVLSPAGQRVIADSHESFDGLGLSVAKLEAMNRPVLRLAVELGIAEEGSSRASCFPQA